MEPSGGCSGCGAPWPRSGSPAVPRPRRGARLPRAGAPYCRVGRSGATRGAPRRSTPSPPRGGAPRFVAQAALLAEVASWMATMTTTTPCHWRPGRGRSSHPPARALSAMPANAVPRTPAGRVSPLDLVLRFRMQGPVAEGPRLQHEDLLRSRMGCAVRPRAYQRWGSAPASFCEFSLQGPNSDVGAQFGHGLAGGGVACRNVLVPRARS